MMMGQPDHAVNIFPMPDIACHSQRSLAIPHPPSRCLDPARIARQHHHARPMVGKDFRNRFPNPHGSACNHNNFPCEIHSALLCSTTREVKRVGYNRARRADPTPTTGDCLDSLIPLFPLDVVLFPGTPLPLHIFEPRYKEMIGECLAQQRTFGVVRAVEQGLAEVGCTAEIITVVKEYPDGRLDLVTEGRKRFELVRVNQERSFLQAEVLLIDDEPGTPPPADSSRAVQLHSELLAIAGAKQDLSAADPGLLSFYLAGSLPLDLDFKQKLLALRSEAERLSLLIQYLETIIPNLRRAATAREKAGGNGHVH
jgi:Lon protease-like protein